ncbi:uncharacterized protein K489DRAFT_7969 [Dissoconium aciculare CBS 342.82]|uniref:UBA domain-containing protein n=1 Tax=Dissoconium aciculare CBS 342.82 TaxID=1314786 RepID=A0A6J3MGR1_9PEZI|nr:uncharacterized protein K489DRAFT_7969 [Dissoconium aciculare CBS 342.82]KAF1827146.1 hypothetical protein K489DRAFT_7969 [Dissoconium aciculare CBS 342.82]
MLEGSYQDLQTRRESTSQALQADQRENTDLKARISHLNAEVARLKTEVEKMKLDARQQKGLVSINKKQIATNENERDRLQKEREDLEKQAQAAAEQSRAVTSPDISAPATTAVPLASPAESLSTTNPFARKAGLEAGNERASSPFTPLSTGSASAASAFDALFGPASTANAESDRTKLSNGSPPVTTFGRASTSTADDFTLPDSKRNDPNAGEPTLPATPPSADRVKDGQYPIDASSPPPPPEGRQFTASQLPIINLEHKAHDSETRSTHVMPPASRAGEPDNSSEFTPTPGTIFGSGNGAEVMPGAFPAAPASGPPTSVGRPQSAKDDFDAAFADFEEDQQSRALASSSNLGPNHNASGSSRSAPEFPPIQTLEHDDEDDDSSDDEDDDDDDAENKVHTGFEDDFSSASAAKGAVAGSGTAPATSNTIAAPVPEAPATPLPAVDAQRSPPTYEESHQPSHGGSAVSATRDAVEFSNAGPSASDVERSLVAPSRTNTVDVFHDASSRPISGATETRAVTDGDQASTNTDILDEFDDFADLAEAKEVDKSASNDIDFGFDRAETAEFNPVFDSPAASTTNTVVSSYPTPVASSRSTGAQENSTGGLLPSKPAVRALDYASNGGSDEQSSKASQHDWDSIFAGLDNTKSIDLSSDPWSSGGSSAGKPAPGVSQTKPQYGTAITPGTEHDDPILKRLTGMGYPRKAALDALEQYDYDINKAVDHLSG